MSTLTWLGNFVTIKTGYKSTKAVVDDMGKINL